MLQGPCFALFQKLVECTDTEKRELADIGYYGYTNAMKKVGMSQEAMDEEFANFMKLAVCIDHHPTRSEYSLFCLTTGKDWTPNEFLTFIQGGDKKEFVVKMLNRFAELPPLAQEGIYDYAMASFIIDNEVTEEERMLFRQFVVRMKKIPFVSGEGL